MHFINKLKSKFSTNPSLKYYSSSIIDYPLQLVLDSATPEGYETVCL